MRARRPHPGNFRVWPFPPSAFLSPGCPRLPPAVPGGRSAQAPAEEESQPARGPPDSRPGTRPCREALPLGVGEKGRLEGAIAGEIGISSQKGTQEARESAARRGVQ